MALIHVNGDVFKQGYDVVMHQANCRKTMGSGIADTVKKRYSEAYKADIAFEVPAGNERLGKFSQAWVNNNSFQIINLYGQDNWKGSGVLTKYDKLEEALRGAMASLSKDDNFSTMKIGIPHGLGCVRAKGKWSVVSEIFTRVSDEFGVTISVCKFEA